MLNLLSIERIAVVNDLRHKQQVMETISGLINKTLPDVPSNHLFNEFMQRENLGSTAIGHGIALPHIRSEAVNEPMGTLILSETGIDFDSPDQQPVDLIFGLIVPQQTREEHLQILARLAEIFSAENNREKLRQAKCATTLYQIALSFENQGQRQFHS